MNINSRRGTRNQSASYSSQYHPNLDRFIQLFLLSTAAIIVIGYYYFISSTVLQKSAVTTITDGNVDSGEALNNDVRNNNNINYIRGSTNTKKAKATIGYAITVTSCPSTPSSSGMLDGAAVLQHSIHLNSIHSPSSNSQYSYQMYALVHPSAISCAKSQLEPLGYKILTRDVPVPLDEIEGEYLRTRVEKNGCCGDKEFVKLHAFTLVQHEVVVHLDLDTLVLRPLDDLFDVMIDGVNDGEDGTEQKAIEVAFHDPLPTKQPINAFFTRDYNMAHKGMKHAGVQGGFLVLRPSMEVYEEFRTVIRKGDFRSNGGWGGLGFGPFYGSMTFQGIIPYFYDHLHPGTGVELDPCAYNNMAHNPRDKPTKNDIVNGNCRNGYNRPEFNDECEDCRSRPLEEVFTTHFTLCQKPWECHAQDGDRIQERLCRKFHGEWYRIREDLETNMWKRGVVDLTNVDETVKVRGGKFQPQQFRGYCKSAGARGYIPITLPPLVFRVHAKAT